MGVLKTPTTWYEIFRNWFLYQIYFQHFCYDQRKNVKLLTSSSKFNIYNTTTFIDIAFQLFQNDTILNN